MQALAKLYDTHRRVGIENQSGFEKCAEKLF